MAVAEINNLVLPTNTILVLPDVDDDTTPTGTIFKRSEMGCKRLAGRTGEYDVIEGNHILFVKEMAVKVKVNGVKYYAMNSRAVVGLIPE